MASQLANRALHRYTLVPRDLAPASAINRELLSMEAGSEQYKRRKDVPAELKMRVHERTEGLRQNLRDQQLEPTRALDVYDVPGHDKKIAAPVAAAPAVAAVPAIAEPPAPLEGDGATTDSADTDTADDEQSNGDMSETVAATVHAVPKKYARQAERLHEILHGAKGGHVDERGSWRYGEYSPLAPDRWRKVMAELFDARQYIKRPHPHGTGSVISALAASGRAAEVHKLIVNPRLRQSLRDKSAAHTPTRADDKTEDATPPSPHKAPSTPRRRHRSPSAQATRQKRADNRDQQKKEEQFRARNPFLRGGRPDRLFQWREQKAPTTSAEE